MEPYQALSQNALLKLLSPAAFEHVASFMRLVDHPPATVIVEKDQSFAYAYFPESGMISSVIQTASNNSVEVGAVGKEGFVGIPMVLGSRISELKLFSQLGGSGWHIISSDFEHLLVDVVELRRLCDLFTMTVIFKASQNIACNQAHSLEQRCARWLLAADDRKDNATLNLSATYIAMMIGEPQGMPAVLKSFNSSGFIEYENSSVSSISRFGLELVSCECYSEIKTNVEKTMSLAASHSS